MNEYFFYYCLFTRIENLLTVAGWIFAIVSIILLINGIMDWGVSNDEATTIKDSLKKRAKKFFKYSIIYGCLVFLLIVTYIIVPNRKEIILYFSFKQVDSYNLKNKQSKLKAPEFLKILDNSLDKIDKMINKFNNTKK